MIWHIPITIIEHNRVAVIEAPTKTAALAKLKAREWNECLDPSHYTVKKVGPARQEQ